MNSGVKPVLLEIPRARYNAAAKVGGVVELGSITLVEGSAFCRVDPATVDTGQSSFELNPSYRFADTGEHGEILAHVRLRLSGAKRQGAPAGDPDEAFAVLAEFQLKYALKIAPPQAEDQAFFFESFCALSAVNHVWPYWREYLDAMMRRMGVAHFETNLIKFVPVDDAPAPPPRGGKKPARIRNK